MTPFQRHLVIQVALVVSVSISDSSLTVLLLLYAPITFVAFVSRRHTECLFPYHICTGNCRAAEQHIHPWKIHPVYGSNSHPAH